MDLPDAQHPDAQLSLQAAPAPPRAPGIAGAIGMVVLYPVMQLAVGVVVTIAFAVAWAIHATLQGRQPGADAILSALQGARAKVVVTVVALVVVAALMLWLIRRRWPAQWHVATPPGFGFVAPPTCWFYAVAVVVAIAGAFGGGGLTALLAHGHAVQQDVTLLGRGVPLLMHLLLAFAVVCVAPVVEEALFRGVLLSGLMRSMPAVWAVLVSAAIFGGVHYPDFAFAWYPLPALMLFGALLGWMRLRSRSLWPAIVMHATNNLVAVVVNLVASGHALH